MGKFSNIKNIIKDNKVKSIFISVLILIIVIGASMAIFFSTGGSTNDKQITFANLKITYTDGQTINNTNNLPIKEDEVDKLASKTSFNVKNEGNVPAYLEIALTDIKIDDALKNEYFRWTLYEEDIKIATGNFKDVKDKLVLMDDLELPVNNNKNYYIAIWILDNEGNQNAMLGKSLKAKITVTGIDKTNSFAFNATNGQILLDNTVAREIRNLKIYGNSVQNGTPTPINPVEIQSVGDLTKNLFDYTKVTGANIETIENGLKLTGYSNVTNITPEMFLEMTGLKIGDTITTTIKKEVINGSKNYIFGSMRFLSTNQSTPVDLTGSYQENEEISTKTITIPENFNSENYKPLYIYGVLNSEENGLNEVHITDIMISKNGETEYTPYGKYKIPVEVSGNLVNHSSNELSDTDGSITVTYNEEKNTYTIKGTQENNTDVYLLNATTSIGELKAGESLTFALKRISGSNTGNIRLTVGFVDEEGSIDWTNYAALSTTNNENIRVSTAQKNVSIKYLRFHIYKGDYDVELQAQILKGSYTSDTLPNYEPYVEPVTTNIYLDEPLRKIGDVSDYIDYGTGKLIRNIYEYRLTGNESGWYDRNLSYDAYGIVFRNPTLTPNNMTGTTALSNYFKYGSIANGRGVFTKASTGTDIQFNIADGQLGISKDETTTVRLQKWLDWLKDRYNDVPVTINYILETPMEEKIDLPTIKSLNGITNIQILTDVKPDFSGKVTKTR